jgi:hypothetical protein
MRRYAAPAPAAGGRYAPVLAGTSQNKLLG